MNTAASNSKESFAIWVTGLPASGKSTLGAALKSQLSSRGIHAAVLESDRLRDVLTPQPSYSDEERELFYQQMIGIGKLLVDQGLPVIFDATANRRRYRDSARLRIPRFLEVFIDSPLSVCQARDPKGIYRAAAAAQQSNTVPGLNATYERPEEPEIVIQSDRQPVEAAAAILDAVLERGWAK